MSRIGRPDCIASTKPLTADSRKRVSISNSELQPVMKALILVDIQKDFLPGGALPVPRGDEVIPVANRVQRVFELVVATQDWHPAKHGSFAAGHPGRKPGEMATLGGL